MAVAPAEAPPAAAPPSSETAAPPDLEPALEADDSEDTAAPTNAEDSDAEAEAADTADEVGDPEIIDEAPATEPPANENRYTGELSDEALEKVWRENPASLGTVAIGVVQQGRLIHARPFPAGENWTIVDPRETYATDETIEYLSAALNRVGELFPGTEPIRINDISRPNGGWIRPHRTHQTGRDVDLSFYYRAGVDSRPSKRDVGARMDLVRNWALIKSLVTLTDVQLILVDRRIQKKLYDHALAAGEDKGWLDSLFHSGKASILQHARRHADHFHVRFYNPRAQELGRRLQPFLGKVRPDENYAIHRVRKGDTLGAIARKYRSTVSIIQKTNRLRGHALSIGQVLMVPGRGPCVHCPVAPPQVVPPRRLPPTPPPVATET